MAPPPALIAWDCDGTLIDTTALIVRSLDHIYNQFYGQTLPEPQLRFLIGTPLRTQLRIFGEPEEFGVSEATVSSEFIQFYEANREEERVLPAVTRLLILGAQRGWPTALVTSKNREELANTLPRLEIAEFLGTAVTADDVDRPKPAPDGLQLAMRRLHVPAVRAGACIYIGDTVHDMEAARAAGFRAVGVTWGAADAASLWDAGASTVCESAAELESSLFGET